MVLDEISFNSAALMGQFDQRMRIFLRALHVTAGCMPVLLAGDCFQKPPVGPSAWYIDLVNLAVGGATSSVVGPKTPSMLGLQFLASAKLVNLKRLMRAEGDAAFINQQLHMRRTDISQPVSDEFLAGLFPVSEEDIKQDESWLFAPIGVLSNIESDSVDLAQLEHFARKFKLPLVKWKLPLVPHNGLLPVDDEYLDDLYRAEPMLWGYFVEGAPGVFIDTIKCVRKLVRGSPFLFDSLVFEDGFFWGCGYACRLTS